VQAFLSGYALWVGRRRQRLGHLFQGRYEAEMIEDESYYWTVSRYIHLNPVRARLVPRAADWEWSSYPDYRTRQRRQAWVAHEALLATRPGDHGNKDTSSADIRFVEAGLKEPPAPPFREAFGGWILRSPRFIDALRTRVGPVTRTLPLPRPGNSPVSTPNGFTQPWPSSTAWIARHGRVVMIPILPGPLPPGCAVGTP
jgi:putative transposase